MSNIRKIKTILSSSRLFEQSSSRNLSAGKLDSTYYNFMTASYLSNEHLQDSMTFAMTAPLIFQINELKEDVDDLHTHLSESLYTNRETSFGGSILVSSHITASGNISCSGHIRVNEIRDNTNSSTLTIRPDGELNLGTAATDEINIGRTSSTSCDINMFANSTDPTLRIVNKTATFNHPVTASADISSSGTITMLTASIGGGIFTSASLAAGGGGGGAVSAVANGSNNRVATFSSGDALNGEANLLFNGSILEIGGKLKVSSHITSSGNISASGNIIADFPDTNDNALHYPLVTDGNTIEKLNDLNFNPSTGLVQVGSSLQVNSTNIVLGSTGTISTTSHITAGGYISSSGAINTLSHITASGNISASGTAHIIGGNVQVDEFSCLGDAVFGRHLSHQGDSDTKITLETNTISITAGNTAHMSFTQTGGTQILTNITASGNISASGVIYGKQIQHTYHQYNNDSLNTGQYIPAPGGYIVEGTSINYYRQWIAPFNGRLRKLMIYCENDPGNARISLYADGSFVKRKTESFGAATSTNFDFDNPDGGGDSVFTAGQRIAILIDPLNIPGDVNVVCTWEYDINL